MDLKPIGYLIVGILFLLSGCATLNQSECLNADWSIIGIEDGAMGRLESYIGNHRSACAKFGVTPDLASYQTGHDQGIRQYCTERNGFARGRSGNRYNGVCPPDLERAFLDAHSLGQEIYLTNRELQNINASIKAKQKEIEKIIITKNEKEQLLIHGRTSPVERALLLEETKELDRSIGPIDDEIYDLEDRREEVEAKLLELNYLNIYQ